MLIKKNDIGGEIISILTRGMYLDPKDALREYVQNGVDASSNEISIEINSKYVRIQDNGTGMNKETMRKSVRVGISEKSPSKNVGFMGIGIYSSFHLCDKLRIYSKVDKESPTLIQFDFKGMRSLLEDQRDSRYESSLEAESIIALQDLLEQHINITTIEESDHPKSGTKVELLGLEPTFYNSISNFEEVASYLQDVIPLPFHPDFSFGKEIHHYVHQICRDHSTDFSIINLSLRINGDYETLYKPYKDSFFEPKPLNPEFQILESDGNFYGVAWACLNTTKKTIKNSVRGFILKKQGFTLGSRNDLLQYFGRPTYFNRYIGEIIVVHKMLLPNASRSEFEYTPLRISFQKAISEMADHYNKFADSYQEKVKALEEFDEAVTYFTDCKRNYSKLSGNQGQLVPTLWKIKNYSKSIDTRKKAGKFEKKDLNKVDSLIDQLNVFYNEMNDLIEFNNKSGRQKRKKKPQSTLKKELEQIPEKISSETPEDYNNIIEVFETIGIDLNKELTSILELIDENFIRSQANDTDDYKNKLYKLKSDFEDILNE